MQYINWPIHTNHCISIYRKYTEWSNAYEYTSYPILVNHKVYIYESNSDYESLMDMSGANHIYTMDTANIDIREDDKIIDENWAIYIARYIKTMISPYNNFLQVELKKDAI